MRKRILTGILLMTASAALHAQAPGGMIHTGMWVEDMDKMVAFFEAHDLGFKVINREARATGGERVYLIDRAGNMLELLSAPEVVPHPEFPLHPVGRVAGIAHLALETGDIVALKERVQEQGYEVLRQAPADFADGYITSDAGVHRIMFVAGPSDVTFEFFEFQEKTEFRYPEE